MSISSVIRSTKTGVSAGFFIVTMMSIGQPFETFIN